MSFQHARLGQRLRLMPSLARAANARSAQNIVFVHGLFADGSCRSEVIARLQAAGLNVPSVQNPLTTLDDAVAESGAASNACEAASMLQAGPGAPRLLLRYKPFPREDPR